MSEIHICMCELSEDAAVAATGDAAASAGIHFRHLASGEKLSVLDGHDAEAVRRPSLSAQMRE